MQISKDQVASLHLGPASLLLPTPLSKLQPQPQRKVCKTVQISPSQSLSLGPARTPRQAIGMPKASSENVRRGTTSPGRTRTLMPAAVATQQQDATHRLARILLLDATGRQAIRTQLRVVLNGGKARSISTRPSLQVSPLSKQAHKKMLHSSASTALDLAPLLPVQRPQGKIVVTKPSQHPVRHHFPRHQTPSHQKRHGSQLQAQSRQTQPPCIINKAKPPSRQSEICWRMRAYTCATITWGSSLGQRAPGATVANSRRLRSM